MRPGALSQPPWASASSSKHGEFYGPVLPNSLSCPVAHVKSSASNLENYKTFNNLYMEFGHTVIYSNISEHLLHANHYSMC